MAGGVRGLWPFHGPPVKKSSTLGMWTRYIYGFPLTYSSTTAVIVGYPNANGPSSLARDAADAAFIGPIAAGTTYTVSTSTHGAVLGDDSFTGAGTANSVSGGGGLTGNSTNWLSSPPWGTRTLTGTIGTGGVSSATITGTGTKFLTEISVNDLIGNSTVGYSVVTAIASDTSLTIGGANLTITNGSTGNAIEQPTVSLTGESNGPFALATISSNTQLNYAGGTNSGTINTAAYQVGRPYKRAAFNGAQFGFPWLVSGGSGTSAVLSTQRTQTYAQAFGGSSGISGYSTSVRNVGGCVFDSSGNITQVISEPDFGVAGWNINAAQVVNVRNSSNQSISNSVSTTLTWDTDLVNPLNLHSTTANTSRLTAKKSGVYQLAAFIYFASNTTGLRQILFLKNGNIVDNVTSAALTGSETQLGMTALVTLLPGDYVECQVWQNSGGSLNVSATSASSVNSFTQFGMSRVGDA